MPALRAYADSTSTPLMRLATASLGGELKPDLRETVKLAGTAYALVGILRATPHLAMQQRVLLPADLLRKAGIAPDTFHQKDHGRAVFEVIADRKSVVEGKSVSVRVDLGGRRKIKK